MSKDEELFNYCLNRIDYSIQGIIRIILELEKREWIQKDVATKLRKLLPPPNISSKNNLPSEPVPKPRMPSAPPSALKGTDNTLKAPEIQESKPNIQLARNVKPTADQSEVIPPVQQRKTEMPIRKVENDTQKATPFNPARESMKPSLPTRDATVNENKPMIPLPSREKIQPNTIPQNRQSLAPQLPVKNIKQSQSIPVQTKVGDVPVEVSVDSAVAASVAQKAVTSGAAFQLAKGIKPKMGADGNVSFTVDPKSAAQAAKTMHNTGATKELIGGMQVKADVGGNQIPISGKSLQYDTPPKQPKQPVQPKPEGRSILEGLPAPPPRVFTKPKVPPGMPPPLNQTNLLASNPSHGPPPAYSETPPPPLPKRQFVKVVKDFNGMEEGDLAIRVGEEVAIISSGKLNLI
ncbi:hypothetical protein HDV04_001124 [Boothiomyces sp. JEL0838]|nr:hypothetical protein HDV04_001124 [Boothiomyces sp. JEL0838]